MLIMTVLWTGKSKPSLWFGYACCFAVLFWGGMDVHASLIDLPTQSGFPTVSVAAREADERRRVYQPKGFEKNGVRFDAGLEERVDGTNPGAWSSGGHLSLGLFL